MNIAIGCDTAAFGLKQVIMDYLTQNNYSFKDFGTFEAADQTEYPLVGEKVALAVQSGEYNRGILLCGTGIGMNITANKIPGISAAVCHDNYSAERARKSNNAQILCMGARVIGPELAKVVLKTWLDSEFVEGSSSPKIELLNRIDEKYKK